MMLTYFVLFLLLFLPFYDFDLDIVSFILSCSCGYYAVSSVSVSAATRLAYDMYLDTYVHWSHFFLSLSEVFDLFELSCLLLFICFPPEVIFRCRVIGGCPVTTDCIERWVIVRTTTTTIAMCLVARKVGSEMPFHRTGYDTQAQHTWCALQQQIHWKREKPKAQNDNEKQKQEKRKKDTLLLSDTKYYFYFVRSLSIVFRTMTRRNRTGCAAGIRYRWHPRKWGWGG